jgi:nucleoside-diphosphate-sugar epimerase
VTGAAGRIGRAILGELRAHGTPAIGVARRAASGICTVDICDSEAQARMMNGCRLVIGLCG